MSETQTLLAKSLLAKTLLKLLQICSLQKFTKYGLFVYVCAYQMLIFKS